MVTVINKACMCGSVCAGCTEKSNQDNKDLYMSVNYSAREISVVICDISQRELIPNIIRAINPKGMRTRHCVGSCYCCDAAFKQKDVMSSNRETKQRYSSQELC